MVTPLFPSRRTTRYGRSGPCMISPPTTDFALVFPLDSSKRKFDKSFYSPALTDGRMSTDQLKIFLKDIEKVIKKKLRPIKALVITYLCLIFIGFFGLLTLASGDYEEYDVNYSDDNSGSDTVNTTTDTDYDYNYDYDDQFDSVIFAFIGYFCLVMLGAVLLQVYIKRRHRKARRCAQHVIDTHSNIFAAQGLRWNIPLAFPFWIELWKDYRGQTNNFVPPVQNYNNYAIPQPLPVLQKHHIMPTLTSQVGYPILSMPSYQTNMPNNMTFTQQPLNGQRNSQEQEQAQYVPPSLNSNNA